jgi:hypothetical protein
LRDPEFAVASDYSTRVVERVGVLNGGEAEDLTVADIDTVGRDSKSSNPAEQRAGQRTSYSVFGGRQLAIPARRK